MVLLCLSLATKVGTKSYFCLFEILQRQPRLEPKWYDDGLLGFSLATKVESKSYFVFYTADEDGLHIRTLMGERVFTFIF